MTSPIISEAVKTLVERRDLTRIEAAAAMEAIMSGAATNAQIAAFLTALRMKGETIEELIGFAQVMRQKAVRVRTRSAEASASLTGTDREMLIDTCGTGGDASGTFNVSTASALVVAACGVPVAKHGNRALSSQAGSADILAALGVNIEADVALIEQAIRDAGIGFMMAPRHHGAMRHVAGPRVELGTRTIFNLLGPLANPAGARRQLIGVFARQWIEPIAHVLGRLGAERAWVVHGSDGLDEITTTGPSHVAELRDGRVTTFEIAPEQVGIARARPEDLRGADAGANAAALQALLDGIRGPYRDIVLLNSAAALVVAGPAEDLGAGVARAAEAIDSGAAKAVLAALVAISNRAPAGE
jgi:anthranilate phosphoribosyltransferase